MTRRLRALVAVMLMLGSLAITPGTAHGTPPTGVAHLIPPLVVSRTLISADATVAPQPISRFLRKPAASRDWLRSPLIVAPPLLAAVAAQPTVPSAPPASPTLGTTQGPAGSGESTPAGSSAANALPRTAADPNNGSASVQGAAQTYARTLVTAAQWPCLRQLWQRESGWRANANNPQSTAFGIAQLLTETSSDWRQQIQRGIAYIGARYGGSACAALSHSNETGWY